MEICCLVCGRNNDDGEEFISLVDHENELTATGLMYEELINAEFKAAGLNMQVVKLCNSCYLQMKLFKELKERALKTLSMLHNSHVELRKNAAANEISEEDDLCLATLSEQEEEEEQKKDSEDSLSDNDMLIVDIQHAENAEKRKKLNRIKGFYCDYCNEHFAKRNAYAEHRRSVHQNKYPCSVCHKELLSIYSLRMHQRLHQEDEGSFKCDICEKSFHQKVHLTNHMNKHKNERPFICEECGKTFANKAGLSIHIRTHTGDKRFICDICGKNFLLSSHLKMHSFTHTDEKNFECDVCKELFSTPVTLRTHKKNTHLESQKIFECKICAIQFSRKDFLNAHFDLCKKQHKRKGSSNNCTNLSEEAIDDVPNFIVMLT